MASGNNGTQRGQQRDKPFRDALRMEIAAAGDDTRSLRRVARALLDTAASGDVQAIREVADRLDGKPAQAIEHTGDNQVYVVRMPAVVTSLDEWDKHANEQVKATH
jgi:HPt (histidine-containing phosphotransfer) domain-containing protein